MASRIPPRDSQILGHTRIETELLSQLSSELGDPLRMASKVEILRFHRVDQSFGDAYGHEPQRFLFGPELRGAKCHFFSNEHIETTHLDELGSLDESTIDGLLEVGELYRLHQVVRRAS